MFSVFAFLVFLSWNVLICGKKKEQIVSGSGPSEKSKAVPPPSVTVPAALASKEKDKVIKRVISSSSYTLSTYVFY